MTCRAGTSSIEFDGEIIRVARDRIGGVKRAGRVDEKSGAEKFSVLIDRADFHDRFRGALKNFLNFATDRAARTLRRLRRRRLLRTHSA